MYFDDLNLKVWYRRHKVTSWEASTAKILIFVWLVVIQPTLPSTADVSSSTAAWAASSPQLSSGTTASGGLAGPTNNDVCLNGGGAALTLYTPCQFPPVRHSVNCCCPQLTTIFPQTQRISLFVTSGFAACSDLLSKAHSWPIWHLSVIRRKLSSNLSNWTQTGCWQLKCRDLSGFCQLPKTVIAGCQQTKVQNGAALVTEDLLELGAGEYSWLGLEGAPGDTWDLQLPQLPPRMAPAPCSCT